MAFTWYSESFDLYPYLLEKLQQGQVWGLWRSKDFPTGLPTHRYRSIRSTNPPHTGFKTHAGTLYNLILPQLHKSKHGHLPAQLHCVDLTTEYWDTRFNMYDFCEPHIRQGRLDDTQMNIVMVLKKFGVPQLSGKKEDS